MNKGILTRSNNMINSEDRKENQLSEDWVKFVFWLHNKTDQVAKYAQLKKYF